MAASRNGAEGVDLFAIAGATISGFFPSQKTGDARLLRMPFTTLVEERLGLYLEYHPLVVAFQRGDASADFARSRRISTPLGTPFPIPYAHEDRPHTYLPDYVGTLAGGGLLIAEAGTAADKGLPRAQAKAEAARRRAALGGGAYWLGLAEQLGRARHQNLQLLHARRLPFAAFEEIAPAVRALWLSGGPLPIGEVVARLAGRWPADQVEGAAWKVAAEAAARGHLLGDLDGATLTLATPLGLLPPGAPPLLPPPLPSAVPRVPPASPAAGDGGRPAQDDGDPPGAGDDAPDGTPAAPAGDTCLLPGRTLDPLSLPAGPARAAFGRNMRAVLAVLGGAGVRETARAHGMDHAHLLRLVRRAREIGQPALVPHGLVRRPGSFHPAFGEKIRELFACRARPTATQVFEDVRMRRLAEELSEQAGRLVRAPSYRQVSHLCRALLREPAVRDAREGAVHPRRGRVSPNSFVHSVAAPALLCQVDEHYLDVLVTAEDGTVLSRRVHAAVAICVKTAAILGAVLALDSLKEEDYMRLIKQCLEPKDALVALYGCEHPWPCHGKPCVVFHDRGKIFTSERAVSVLVDRLGIATEQAPPYCPSAKGTVEALFTWICRKLSWRLPGTTRGRASGAAGGGPAAAAGRAGVRLELLEQWFYRSITDGYMREWDTLRGGTRAALWDDAVRTCGVPRYLGSPADLLLLLLKANNRKKGARTYTVHPYKGVVFLGRCYVAAGLTSRLAGQEVEVYYDRRDLAVIYLFHGGVHVGEAYCVELSGRRLSEAESRAERKASAPARAAAAAESLAGRQAVQEQVLQGKAAHRKEATRIERARQLDLQRGAAHPDHVRAALAAMDAARALREAEAPPAAPAPGPALPPAAPDDDGRPVRRPLVRAVGA